MTIQEIEQELFEMERKLKSMFNSCSQDLAVGIEKLRGELAELKESKKEGKWKPEKGEIYWYRNDIGAIDCDEVCNTTAHDWQLNNLPIFKDGKQCERYWHFMDAVKEKSYEFSREDFENDDITEYTIEFNGKAKEFRVGSFCRNRELGCIYFKTEADAQFIIDNFKEELLEYWL